MNLKQIFGREFITEPARRSLETTVFNDLGNASRFVQRHFPNHVVLTQGDHIVVSNKDRSVNLAVFTAVRLRDQDSPW